MWSAIVSPNRIANLKFILRKKTPVIENKIVKLYLTAAQKMTD